METDLKKSLWMGDGTIWGSYITSMQGNYHTMKSSMNLAEPSMQSNSSLFYNTSLPLLEYTESQAVK